MANYSFQALGESAISLTGGAVLDGVTQGDGSHLVGEFLTINIYDFTELFVTDSGSDVNFDDNDGNQVLDGAQSFDGSTYADGTRIEAEYQFVVEDSFGTRYTVLAVNFNNSSPAYGTVEGLAFVDALPPLGEPLRIVSAAEGPGSGARAPVDEVDIVPLCFGAGTLVDTALGPRPVETVQTGEMITTAKGQAPLRLALHSRFDSQALAKNPRLRPVRIRAGTLGGGLPWRDLWVSRQHRMLVTSVVAQRMFGTRAVLIPAIRLTVLDGIEVDLDISDVAYHHLLFDHHELVLAEGAVSESLYPAAGALAGVPPALRDTLAAGLAGLEPPAALQPPAALIPPRKQQKRLLERLMRNGKPLCEAA